MKYRYRYDYENNILKPYFYSFECYVEREFERLIDVNATEPNKWFFQGEAFSGNHIDGGNRGGIELEQLNGLCGVVKDDKGVWFVVIRYQHYNEINLNDLYWKDVKYILERLKAI